ncbi:hypothetical protein CRG98_001938 [Punica granatum]|uniref:Uncharacterized protein n=1 Tax=Punica granatum TaxID=22663 RepID=A0A2I0LAE5_PUNGR|nr:hypothetical protein CRG98_001938 [Punica granatum]
MGDSYVGEWWKGRSYGMGVQTCGDGNCSVGEFNCGVKHGLGCYHFRNGDRYAGEYFGDKIYGLESTTLPMIIAMRDRSMKVARKAAENVIHLRRVDKQVTKAVMAANRAATAARVAVVKAIQNRMDGKFCDLDI